MKQWRFTFRACNEYADGAWGNWIIRARVLLTKTQGLQSSSKSRKKCACTRYLRGMWKLELRLIDGWFWMIVTMDKLNNGFPGQGLFQKIFECYPKAYNRICREKIHVKHCLGSECWIYVINEHLWNCMYSSVSIYASIPPYQKIYLCTEKFISSECVRVY